MFVKHMQSSLLSFIRIREISLRQVFCKEGVSAGGTVGGKVVQGEKLMHGLGMTKRHGVHRTFLWVISCSFHRRCS